MILFILFQLNFAQFEDYNCYMKSIYDVFAQEKFISILTSSKQIEKASPMFSYEIAIEQNITVEYLNLSNSIILDITQLYSNNLSQVLILSKIINSNTYQVSKFRNKKYILQNNQFLFLENVKILAQIEITNFSCNQMQQQNINYIIIICQNQNYHKIVILSQQDSHLSIYIHRNISQKNITIIQYKEELYFIFKDSVIRKIFQINLNELNSDEYYYSIESIQVAFDFDKDFPQVDKENEKIMDFILENENQIEIVFSNISLKIQLDSFQIVESKNHASLEILKYIDVKNIGKQFSFYIQELKYLQNFQCFTENQENIYIFSVRERQSNFIIIKQDNILSCLGKISEVLYQNLNLVPNFIVKRINIQDKFIILNSSNIIYFSFQEKFQNQSFLSHQINEQKLIIDDKQNCFLFRLINESLNQNFPLQIGQTWINLIGYVNQSYFQYKLLTQLTLQRIRYPFEIKKIVINKQFYLLTEERFNCNIDKLDHGFSLIKIILLTANQGVLIFSFNNQLLIYFCFNNQRKILSFHTTITQDKICFQQYFIYISESNMIHKITINNEDIIQQVIYFSKEIIYLGCQRVFAFIQFTNFNICELTFSNQIIQYQTNFYRSKISSLSTLNNLQYIVSNQKLQIFKKFQQIAELDDYQYYQIQYIYYQNFILLAYDQQNNRYCLIVYRQTQFTFRMEKILPLYNFTINLEIEIKFQGSFIAVNMNDKYGNFYIFIYDCLNIATESLILIFQVKKPLVVCFHQYYQFAYYENGNLILRHLNQNDYYFDGGYIQEELFHDIEVEIEYKQFLYSQIIEKQIIQKAFYVTNYNILKRNNSDPLILYFERNSIQPIRIPNLQGSIFVMNLEESQCAKIINPINILYETQIQEIQKDYQVLLNCRQIQIYQDPFFINNFIILDLEQNKFYNQTIPIQYLCSYERSFCNINRNNLYFFCCNRENDDQSLLFLIRNLYSEFPEVVNIKLDTYNYLKIRIVNEIIIIQQKEYLHYYLISDMNELIKLISLTSSYDYSNQFFFEENQDMVVFLIVNNKNILLKLLQLDPKRHQFSTRNLQVTFPNIFFDQLCFQNFQFINGLINQNLEYELSVIFNCFGFSLISYIVVDKEFTTYTLNIKHKLRYVCDNSTTDPTEIIFVDTKFIILKVDKRLLWYWIQDSQSILLDCYFSESFWNFSMYPMQNNSFFLIKRTINKNINIQIVNIQQYQITLNEDYKYCETAVIVSNDRETIKIPIILKEIQLESSRTISYGFYYCLVIFILVLIFIIRCLLKRRKLIKMQKQLKQINDMNWHTINQE